MMTVVKICIEIEYIRMITQMILIHEEIRYVY